MALTDQAAGAAPYLRQLLCDQQVHDAIRRTAAATRDTYERAQGKSAREAVKDEKLRRRLQQAVGAGREVWSALGQPPRRKRRWRLRLSALALGGAGVLVAANPTARQKARAVLGGEDPKTAGPQPDS